MQDRYILTQQYIKKLKKEKIYYYSKTKGTFKSISSKTYQIRTDGISIVLNNIGTCYEA